MVFKPGGEVGEKGGKGDVWERLRAEEGLLGVGLETMGSVWLVVQAVLPVLLFPPTTPPPPNQSLAATAATTPATTPAATTGEKDGDSKPARLRLRLEGGTFASFAPTTFYVKHVLVPVLRSVVGVPPGLEVRVEREGFSTGPRMRAGGDREGEGVGRVEIDVVPFAEGEGLDAFNMEDRGVVVKVGVCVAAHREVIGVVEEEARRALEEEIGKKGGFGGEKGEVGIEIEVRERIVTSSPSHLSLLVLAETSSGCVLARDCLWEKKVHLKPNAIRNTAETIARKVVGELVVEVTSGACVDEHMADQLVVFQALSKGKGNVKCAEEVSLHTKTARWVAESVLGGQVRFGEDGSYEGCGYRGIDDWGRRISKSTSEANADTEGTASTNAMAQRMIDSSEMEIGLISELERTKI